MLMNEHNEMADILIVYIKIFYNILLKINFWNKNNLQYENMLLVLMTYQSS